MWRLIFFLPLLALTIYIFIKTHSDEEETDEEILSEEEQAEEEEYLEEKEHLMTLAIRMLKKGKDYADEEKIEADFKDCDFSDPEKPQARFVLFTDRKTIPFAAKNGNLIRYRDKQ